MADTRSPVSVVPSASDDAPAPGRRRKEWDLSVEEARRLAPLIRARLDEMDRIAMPLMMEQWAETESEKD